MSIIIIEIASPFCSFLNISFSAGEVPYTWKIANIVPVHKKGRKDYRENYRQISLTSVACKVSEKIVKDRVVNFWQDLNVFNPNQFGFLEGKSTLSQLLCCFHDWASSRNKSRPTDAIFLDFSKAFDSVSHERLLLKLKCHGIDGSLLHWLSSFLTDRISTSCCSRHPLILDLCNVGGSPGYDPGPNFIFYHPHFEITVFSCNLIGSQQCNLFPNCTIFCSKSHPFFKPIKIQNWFY